MRCTEQSLEPPSRFLSSKAGGASTERSCVEEKFYGSTTPEYPQSYTRGMAKRLASAALNIYVGVFSLWPRKDMLWAAWLLGSLSLHVVAGNGHAGWQ